MHENHTVDTTHNMDRVIKEAFEMFVGNPLDFLREDLGLVVEILTTEITQTTTKKAFADFCARMSTGKLVHIEWEYHVSKADILRFASYNIDLARKHNADVTTFVLTARKPAATCFDGAVLKFFPIVLDLSERDAVAVLDKVRADVAAGKPLSLLDLVFCQKYDPKTHAPHEVFEKACRILLEYGDTERVKKIATLMLLTVGHMINTPEGKSILEVHDMLLENNVFFQLAQERGIKLGEERGMKLGEERGIKLGREDGIKLGKEVALQTAAKSGATMDVLERMRAEFEIPRERLSQIISSMTSANS